MNSGLESAVPLAVDAAVAKILVDRDGNFGSRSAQACAAMLMIAGLPMDVDFLGCALVQDVLMCLQGDIMIKDDSH